MWELDCEEGWALKNWCFWTVVLEKTLESPLDCKEIQPVHSEGDQPCDFFGRNDAKAETPVLWPPHSKSWLIGKDSDAGRDWGQEDKGMTEDEMAGWHHWLDGRQSEWTPELVMDREAWRAAINGVAKRWTRLSDWIELNQTELKDTLGFPGGAVVKDGRDTGSISWSGRSPGEGNGNPLQYSSLGNPMKRGAWWATDNGVAKIWTPLSTNTHHHHTKNRNLCSRRAIWKRKG